MDTVNATSRRWSTVAAILVAGGIGAVALAVLPNVMGGGECGQGGDCPDIVIRNGTEYVLMVECQAVKPALHKSPRKGVFKPAVHGAAEAEVSTFAIAGLPADEVIAVVGPGTVVCPYALVPGSGVAFSSKTDARTTAQRIDSMTRP